MLPRVLDPLERTSEVLFGLIMVLTFTGSVSVAEAGYAEVRSTLIAAIGCNLAWGIVDAVMYLMSAFMGRARALTIYRTVRGTQDPITAHTLIREALPSVVSATLTDAEVQSLHERLRRQPEPTDEIRLRPRDFVGAAGVFLLVFLSTFPVVVPFLIVSDPLRAMRLSNAVAVILLFIAGWSLGRHAGMAGWRVGGLTVTAGVVLVALTMALGG
jgi:VIT1/CCC1 family predicted Fe2+/Mn2+ transporter